MGIRNTSGIRLIRGAASVAVPLPSQPKASGPRKPILSEIESFLSKFTPALNPTIANSYREGDRTVKGDPPQLFRSLLKHGLTDPDERHTVVNAVSNAIRNREDYHREWLADHYNRHLIEIFKDNNGELWARYDVYGDSDHRTYHFISPKKVVL